MSFIQKELIKSIIELGIKERSDESIKIYGTGVLVNYDNFAIIVVLKSLLSKLSKFDDFFFFYYSTLGKLK